MHPPGRGGRIINISSINGPGRARQAASYRASKGAVRELVYAEQGIRVDLFDHDVIGTPIAGHLAPPLVDEPELLAEFGTPHPLGRAGEVDDIAWGVVYLASDESRLMAAAS